MIENSTRGLTLLDAAHTVVVTGVEHHQPVLAPWAPGPDGRPRHVAAELVPATIPAGPDAGRRGIEVRLDGRRAGELTLLLSERYLPHVDDVLRDGGTPACVALVAFGPHELEMELQLPDVSEAATTAMAVVPSAPRVPERRRSRTPYLIGAGVLALLLGVGLVVGTGNRGSDLADYRPPVAAATPTSAPPPSVPAAALPSAPAELDVDAPTTTRRTPTSAPVTTPAPPPPATDPVAAAPTASPAPPAPTTARTTTTAPPRLLGPRATRTPNYDDCREARADGATNIPSTDPRYDDDLDDDEDGVACGPRDR